MVSGRLCVRPLINLSLINERLEALAVIASLTAVCVLSHGRSNFRGVTSETIKLWTWVYAERATISDE
jgi:hypothetical protein